MPSSCPWDRRKGAGRPSQERGLRGWGGAAAEDNTAGAGALLSQRQCAGCRVARAGVFNAVMRCTKRLLSAAVSVA